MVQLVVELTVAVSSACSHERERAAQSLETMESAATGSTCTYGTGSSC